MSTMQLPNAFKKGRKLVELSSVTPATRKGSTAIPPRHPSMLGLHIRSSTAIRGSARRIARAALDYGRNNATQDSASDSATSSALPHDVPQLRGAAAALAPIVSRPAPSAQNEADPGPTHASPPPPPRPSANDITAPAAAQAQLASSWTLPAGRPAWLPASHVTTTSVTNVQHDQHAHPSATTCTTGAASAIPIPSSAGGASANSSAGGDNTASSASSRRLEASTCSGQGSVGVTAAAATTTTDAAATAGQHPPAAPPPLPQRHPEPQARAGADDRASERRSSTATTSGAPGRGTVRYHLSHRHNQQHHHHQHPLHLSQREHRHRHPHVRPVHLPHAAAPHHPTLRLIASRLRSGSQPGARRDGARLGLVVEGGGMRGCISGAMLMALHDLGLTHVFDVVYGASAGAINATYFLAGQRHGLRIYHEDLTQGSAFLDFRNLFSSSNRPVMNIDFLIDQVMTTSKPLDWDAVLTSPTPLKVVASCIDSLQPVLLSDFAGRDELAAALKATAAVPQFAGPPRVVRGRSLVDAAVFEPVPVPTAIRDGCSHVLALCTRPAPTQRSPWVKRVRSTIEVLAKKTVLNAPYMREAWRTARSPSFASKDEQLVAALQSCPHEFRRTMGAYVLPIYPEHTAGCHPLCLDPATLRAACDVGHSTLTGVLGPLVEAVSGVVAGRNGGAVEGSGDGELSALPVPYGVGLDEQPFGGQAGADGEVEGALEEVGKEVPETVSAGVVTGGGGAGGSFGGAAIYSAGLNLRFQP